MLQKSKKLMQTERNLLTFVDTIQKLVIFVYTICLTVGVLRVPQTPKHLNECLKCTLSVLLQVSHRWRVRGRCCQEYLKQRAQVV